MKKIAACAAIILSLSVPFTHAHAYSLTNGLVASLYLIYSPFSMSANLTTHGDALYGVNSCKQEIAIAVKNDIEDYLASGVASEALDSAFAAISKEAPDLSEQEMIDSILAEFEE